MGARSRQQLSEDPGGSGQNSLTGEASQYRQERGAEIAAIAGKRLITAVTGKDHFNMSARVLRHGECWDSRGVREGLVVVPRNLWNEPGNVRTQKHLVMISRISLSDRPRKLPLVEQRIFESHGKRLALRPRLPRRERGNKPTVDSSGQEDADRHIGTQS